MMWYYTTNGERLGPLSLSGMKSLYEQQAITPETLVWQEGMTEWKPLSETRLAGEFQVPLPEGDAWEKCAFSGQHCRRSEMVQVEGRWINPDYKDEAVEFLKEGGALTAFAQSGSLTGNLDFGHLMRSSGALLAGCWREALVIHLLVWLPANLGAEYVAAVFENHLSQTTLVQCTQAAANFWGLLATGAVLHLLSDQIIRKPASIGDVLKRGLSCWGHLWVASLLSGLAIIFGTILFIIPGIIAAVRLSLVNPAVVNGGRAGSTAIDESWLLTRGRFWPCLGYLLIVGILCSLPAIIVITPEDLAPVLKRWFLAAPLTTIATAPMIYLHAFTLVLYRELKAMPPAP